MDFKAREALKTIPMDYTNCMCQFQKIELGEKTTLFVVGDAMNGSYEFLIVGPCLKSYSNVGYGDQAIALRDGLCSYYGNPGEEE